MGRYKALLLFTGLVFWSCEDKIESLPYLAEKDYTNNIFSDNMVLQRDVTVKIYGTADEGEAITVTIDGTENSTITDSLGKWSVDIPPHVAGGPYTMQNGNDTKYHLHCLRHTFAVRRYLQTRDIYLVKQEMGHASVKTTEKYAKFSLRRLEKDFPSIVESHKTSENTQIGTQFVGTPPLSTDEGAMIF